MKIKVNNCINCPFKIEDFGNEDEKYDTLIFCQLSKFLNRNLSPDIQEQTTIKICYDIMDDLEDIDTPDWCPLHEVKIVKDETC